MAVGKDCNTIKSGTGKSVVDTGTTASWARSIGMRGDSARNDSISAGRVVSSQVQTFVSRIGRGCHVKGSLELVGTAQIDGGVEGQIVCSGELVVGETGIINGRITTESIKVFGQIVGDIVCSESLEFHAGARVKGDIRSPQVIITDGVLYEGHCTMPVVEAVKIGVEALSVATDSSSIVTESPNIVGVFGSDDA